MAINKVIDRNNNVLIDLTNDTVSPNKVLAGTKFHGPDGKEYEGTLTGNRLDVLKYNFVDFDGTLMYSFSDEEIDALTSMPAGPDHTDDNLTFQDWNWDLEDLKNWDRTRPDRPIVGANLITTDGKTYIYFEIIKDNIAFNFYSGYPKGFNSIDWGDGSAIETTISQKHTYAKKGKYVITLDPNLSATESSFRFVGGSSTPAVGGSTVYKVRLGKNLKMSSIYFYENYVIEDINIPINENETSWRRNSSLFESRKIKAFVIPKNIEAIESTSSVVSSTYSILKAIDQNANFSNNSILSINGKLRNVNNLMAGFSGRTLVFPSEITGTVFGGGNCYQNLESLYLPDGVEIKDLKRCKLEYLDLSRSNQTSFSDNAFEYSYYLRNIILPPNLTSIPSYCFSGCFNLRYIKIPDSVTSIKTGAFTSCMDLEIDLSEQTKVITLNGSILGMGGTGGGSGTYNLTILVPLALLDQYKSASYWSNYADYMVGV